MKEIWRSSKKVSATSWDAGMLEEKRVPDKFFRLNTI